MIQFNDSGLAQIGGCTVAAPDLTSADGRVVMETASIGRLIYRHGDKSASRLEGFSLLEMMMVITAILIVASIFVGHRVS